MKDGDVFRFEPIERKTIVTEITRRLLDYLLSGQLKPGDRLPAERQLSEVIGVGRSSLREALKALTVLGLLEVRQGDGTYLKRADSDLLPQVIEWGILLGERRTLDLIEARQHLEISIAGMAALRRDESSLTELRGILSRMQAARRDSLRYTEADVAFHLKLAEMARNTVMKEMLTSIQALLQAWIKSVIMTEGSADFSYEEHVPIYEAVASGNAAEASAAMERHMQSAAERLKRIIAQSEGSY